MNINFEIVKKPNILYLYDVSTVDVNTSGNITTWELSITVPSEEVFTFDIKEYIENRESYEISKFVPTDFDMTNNFTDGLYYFTYKVNDDSITKKYILYDLVQSNFDSLVEEYDLEVSTGTYSIESLELTTNSKTEQMAIANALLIQLRELTEDTTSTEVNRIISKLRRILEIIDTEI